MKTSMQLRQMDRAAKAAREMANLAPIVPGGWLMSLRKALGISRQILAARLKIHPTTLLASEKGEVDGTITLNQLRRIASALDCTVVYAVVPREAPSDVLMREAEKVAQREMSRLFHTMDMEKQSVAADARRRLFEEYKKELLENPKLLWRSK